MANGDAKTSGDGKTSPFGSNGGPMAGVDFVKNPAGSSASGAGVNFLTNPAGSGPSAPTPPNFAAGPGGSRWPSGLVGLDEPHYCLMSEPIESNK